MVDKVNPYPETIEAAARAKGAGALLYAGGTDLMARRAHGAGPDPDAPFVFLNSISRLKGITLSEMQVRIGAMTTMAEIACSPLVPTLLARACGVVGSPALRNSATIGGNVATASPCGDSLPALYVLSAEVELHSPAGSRRLPISECITGPGCTVLRPDELLSAIYVPATGHYRFHHRKVSPRVANAITKVSIAAAAAIEDGIITDIRIAFGAVGPTVIRCTPLERKLTDGRTAVQDLGGGMEQFKALAADLVKPIDDLRSTAEYRRTVAANLLQEFLMSLSGA